LLPGIAQELIMSLPGLPHQNEILAKPSNGQAGIAPGCRLKFSGTIWEPINFGVAEVAFALVHKLGGLAGRDKLCIIAPTVSPEDSMQTPESSLEALTKRVANLESQNRRLKKAGTALLYVPTRKRIVTISRSQSSAKTYAPTTPCS
jgi:hypothetical protein